MKLLNAFKTAIKGLTTNKGRSALTILGVLIGVAAVIGMMSIGQGAQNLILGQIKGLGSNLIFIMPGNIEDGPPSQSAGAFTVETLTREDAEALKERSNLPYVKEVMPAVRGQTAVSYRGEKKKAGFMGTTPNLPDVNDIYPQKGRFFTRSEEKGMARVAVLGIKIKEDLFGQSDAVNQEIKIKRRSFEVIGVMEKRGTSGMEDLDEQIYLPFSTAQKQIMGIDHLNAIEVEAQSDKLIAPTISDIKNTLRMRHNISDPSEDDFSVKSQKKIAETMGVVTQIFTILLALVAGISLVVGGIGIMNIMLTSVTERTREIGLRKAMGATKKDILKQFLLEAVILTLAGGALGVAFGALFSWGASAVFEQFLGSSVGVLISLPAIALGVGISVAIGLIFGIYPAKKAANLSPIEALRYE